MTDRVKATLKQENTDFAVILGRLTSFFQLLKVSLNKLFKDGVRKKWMQWMADRIYEFTATRRQKKHSKELQYRSRVTYHLSSREKRDASREKRDASRKKRDASQEKRESLNRGVWNILLARSQCTLAN